MLTEIHDYCITTLAPGVKKVKLLTTNALVVDNVQRDTKILPLFLIQFPDGRIDPLSNLGRLLTFLGCTEVSELPGKEIDIDIQNKKFYITGLK